MRGAVLSAVLFLACSAADAGEAGADLGAWGERVERRIEQTATVRFRESAAARERFAAVYPTMHHNASAEAFFAGLEADPALAATARDLRAAVHEELQASDDDASAMRGRWDDPEVQQTVARRVASAVMRALQATSPGAAGA